MVFSKVSLNREFFDRWKCQAAEGRTRRARFLMIGGMALWGRLVRVESFSRDFASVTFTMSNVVMGKLFVYSYDLGWSEFGETSSSAHHAGQLCPSMNVGSGPRCSTRGKKSKAKTEVLLQWEWSNKFVPVLLSQLGHRAVKLLQEG